MYSGKKNKNKPLLALVDHFARDLADCFHRPIKVDRDGTERSFFLCTLGMKGDWPALTKIGQLRRHHLRDTWSTNTGVGICHRCLGGQEGHSWHDVSYENMLAMRRDVPVPWTSTPGIISNLPVSSKHVADFFKIDLFHTFHKGVFADAAANAIVTFYDFDLLKLKSLDQYMHVLYEDARAFCAGKNYELHMCKLTTQQLGLTRSTDYPAGSWFKGADTTVLCKFMQHKLESIIPELSHDENYSFNVAYLSQIVQLLGFANTFMHVCYNSGLWLTVRQRDLMVKNLVNFLKTWAILAQSAFN
ncbi:unnamed protein product, partial [Symbiodinium pilosum]